VRSRVEAFVARRWLVPRETLHVDIRPLRGGLESAVWLATVRPDPRHPTLPDRFVVKELQPGHSREADVYALLATHLRRPLSAEVLGTDSAGGTRYLYLEEVRSISSWPWSDILLAATVCRELARFHDSTDLPVDVFAWDHDGELAKSAEATLATAGAANDSAGTRLWRRPGDLRRVVSALPAIRAHLRSLPTTVIHGDVHPGNVILRVGPPQGQVALIDWGRARIGSPLEDVASWLHSLGCWEPRARCRHDTLLRAYLESRSAPRPLNAPLRRDYWFASVSNGLSGAIRYHLAVLSNTAATESMQYHSRRALRAWQRVVRRAAALLGTSRSCCTRALPGADRWPTSPPSR
jgi:hypothetical protein